MNNDELNTVYKDVTVEIRNALLKIRKVAQIVATRKNAKNKKGMTRNRPQMSL